MTTLNDFRFIYTFVYFSILFFLFTSCTKKNDKTSLSDSQTQIATISHQSNYLKIEDATTFDSSWSKENTVVNHVTTEPNGLHPCNDNSVLKPFIFQYTHRTILTNDLEHLTLKPALVKKMPQISADNLQFMYELKEGIKWDDGTPLSYEDILFTIKAVKCPLVNNPHQKPYLDNLKNIIPDPADPLKFTLLMKKTYIQNLAFLTDLFILQRKFYDPENILSSFSYSQFDDTAFHAEKENRLTQWANEFNSPKYSRSPEFIQGLGPYRIAQWEAGQYILLVKKATHWTSGSTDSYDAAYPGKIIFKINQDMNSQMLELKSQAMDVTTFLSVKTLSTLQHNELFIHNYHSGFTDTYNYTYIGLNTKPDGITRKKSFTEKNVRRAIAHLVPVNDLINVLRERKGTRMIGPVSPLKTEYNHDLPLIAFDLEKAKNLLDSAGWKDTDGDNIRDKIIDGVKTPFIFDLGFATTQVEWKDLAMMLAESFYKAGVKAELRANDFAVHIENNKNHNFDMMLGAWAASSQPEDFTQLWHTSSWTSKGSNYCGFGNEASDMLIDSIRFTMDESIRFNMIKRLQKIIYDEQPYIFLWSGIRCNAIHKRFGNANLYFERPGVMLNNLKLLYNSGASLKPSGEM